MNTMNKTKEKDVSIIEQYLISKRGTTDGGEDRLVLGPHYYGVIDGATDKGGNNWSPMNRHTTGGTVMARILKGELECEKYRDIDTIIEICNRIIYEIAEDIGIDMDTVYNRPAAVFTVYDSKEYKIYRIGDCVYLFIYDDRYESFYNEHPLGKITSKMRADILIPAIKDGFDMSEDIGRKAIMPILERQTELMNIGYNDESIWFPEMLPGIKKNDIVIKVINGITVEVDSINIPNDVKEIVITSDGFSEVLPDLESTLSKLKEQLIEDPYCIGVLCSTKGIRPGNVSFDDMAYLRIRIE